MASPSKREVSDWFNHHAKTAAGYRRNIVGNKSRARSSTVIGKMYFFYYDPKHKATLPMYDKFPLVLPIEMYNDGFLGLNLHYLNQGARKMLLERLMQYRNNPIMDETTKLRMSYSLLSGTKTMKLAEPCIKRYLYGHVRSEFIEITAGEWDKAMALPVESFVTKTR